MHYIKCNKCSRLVEVKSEYMVLCPGCKRKMDNSYPAWHEKNTDATFRDYLSEVCVSREALEGVGDQQKITKSIGRGRSTKRWFIALGIAIAVTAGAIWGVNLYKGSRQAAAVKALLNSAWKIAYYEDLTATVKFPYELNPQPMMNADSLNSDSTQVVLGAVGRRWAQEAVASVTATRIEYRPDFGINRDMATEQILTAIVQDNGVRGLRYVPSDYSMGSGFSARMFTGSYLIGPQPYEFRAVMAIRDNIAWYFMVSYFRDMPEGTLVADKFFNGILIDG